jgi:alpha-1,6-mannosyltransferase
MPVQRSPTLLQQTAAWVLFGTLSGLAYFAQRDDFHIFITCYGLAFICWLYLKPDAHWMLYTGIALRVVLLFSVPNFSDDIWRFIWDGRLSAAGIHPFAHIPDYYMENQVFPQGISPDLYQRLNSPHWHTVYPPVSQAVFWLAGRFFATSDYAAVVLIKWCLLMGELGVIGVLYRWNLSAAALYALNPLVILETIGNAHFEGMMLFFLLAGIYAFQQRKDIWGALFMALSFATKLTPLLFLPLIWVHLGCWRGFRVMLWFGLFSILLFLPLLDMEVARNMGSSIGLYFQKFQFNASFYYLIRAVGLVWIGRETGFQFGPWLSLVVLAAVLLIAYLLYRKKISFVDSLLFASFLQLSLSSTVHPWYVVLPFGIALLGEWRFPWLWTGLVALSYSHYQGGGLKENFLLIGLEYGVLWLFLVAEVRARHLQWPSPTSPRR